MPNGSTPGATEHPRPLLRRACDLIDGTWDSHADSDGKFSRPASVDRVPKDCPEQIAAAVRGQT